VVNQAPEKEKSGQGEGKGVKPVLSKLWMQLGSLGRRNGKSEGTEYALKKRLKRKKKKVNGRSELSPWGESRGRGKK